MLLFGGNPGGSDLERFSDLWRLDLQHDSHVIIEVHNLIKICKYHYLLSQDKSSAACLYLRSLQHIKADMKAQESFNLAQSELHLWHFRCYFRFWQMIKFETKISFQAFYSKSPKIINFI